MENLKKYMYSLSEFSEESWAYLLECVSVLEIKKNEYLLKEGDVCRSILFIVSGLCRSVYNQDGKNVNTGFFLENEFVTNINSLKNSSPSEYSIISCEKMKVLRLERLKLLETYKKSHEIETAGRKMLENILAKQENQLNTFRLLTPRQRFFQLAETQPELLQRVSLTQIASFLGMSRETLSRLRAIK
jgi:CRP-like cAMP-binding protein